MLRIQKGQQESQSIAGILLQARLDLRNAPATDVTGNRGKFAKRDEKTPLPRPTEAQRMATAIEVLEAESSGGKKRKLGLKETHALRVAEAVVEKDRLEKQTTKLVLALKKEVAMLKECLASEKRWSDALALELIKHGNEVPFNPFHRQEVTALPEKDNKDIEGDNDVPDRARSEDEKEDTMDDL